MNKDEFEGKWTQMRGRVHEWWGRLTDDDLDRVQGRYETFVGLVQERYGHTRERVENEVTERMHDFQASVIHSSQSPTLTESQHVELHAEAAAVGDFAAGEHQAPVGPTAPMGFAEGQRDQKADPTAATGPDFARGQRKFQRDFRVKPDFARGERHDDHDGPKAS